MSTHEGGRGAAGRVALHASLCLGAMLSLQSPAAAEVIAIVGGTVETASAAGSIPGGTVLIRDGRIVAVGAEVEIPAGASRIDARGKIVTPGLVDPESILGIVEVNAEPGTVDHTVANDHFGAVLEAADAFNPRSIAIPVNRIEGVTRAIVSPTGVAGAVVVGRSAAVNLGDLGNPVDRRHVAVRVQLGEAGAAQAGGSRTAALARLREALADARDYQRHHGAWEQAARRDYGLHHFDLEALQPVLRGEMPLAVEVHRARDIEVVVQLAVEHGIRLVVIGGAEAWMVADELAAAGAAVVLDPVANLPMRFETLGATLENAARLHAAGVPIALMTPMGRGHNPRNVTQGAGVAVAHGLPWQAGLAAITASPARIFGLEGVGQLQPGFEADVVIWDGDPLEVTSYPDAVFIKGRAVPMESRQTLLRDRYMERLGLPRAR